MKKIPYIKPTLVYICSEPTIILAGSDGDETFPPGGGGGTEGDISGDPGAGGNAKPGFGYGFDDDDY